MESFLCFGNIIAAHGLSIGHLGFAAALAFGAVFAVNDLVKQLESIGDIDTGDIGVAVIVVIVIVVIVIILIIVVMEEAEITDVIIVIIGPDILILAEIIDVVIVDIYIIIVIDNIAENIILNLQGVLNVVNDFGQLFDILSLFIDLLRHFIKTINDCLDKA